MLVIKVDHLDSEPLAGSPRRPSGHKRDRPSRRETRHWARGRCRTWSPGTPVAAVADRLADQLLVLPHAVHVGGVEEIDAALDRVMDGRDRFLLVCRRRRIRSCPCSQGRSPRLRGRSCQGAACRPGTCSSPFFSSAVPLRGPHRVERLAVVHVNRWPPPPTWFPRRISSSSGKHGERDDHHQLEVVEIGDEQRLLVDHQVDVGERGGPGDRERRSAASSDRGSGSSAR